MAPSKGDAQSLATIRPMSGADIPSVVSVHMAGFPGFFLTFLGPRFLTLLYRSFVETPEGVALVAESDGRVEGFVAGVTRQSGFYGRLVRSHKWSFAWAAAGAVIRRPSIALRLLRALRRPKEAGDAAAEACLMSIAVRPESERLGIGGTLVNAFSAGMAARGVRTYCLTTDRDGNERVNRFYQRAGFALVRSYSTPEGRAMNEYLMELDQQGSPHRA